MPLGKGLPRWLSGKESICQRRRTRRYKFHTWIEKIPRRRNWQPTSVFLSGKFHGQKSLEGYHLWGRKESDTVEQLSTHSSLYKQNGDIWIGFSRQIIPFCTLQAKKKKKNCRILVYSIHAVVSVGRLCPTLLWPHGLQPTRLLCRWDFPGKYTGVGCHFLLWYSIYISYL